MKKFLALFLVCCLTLAFVACGGNDESSKPAESAQESGESQSVNESGDDKSEAESENEASSEATPSEDASSEDNTSSEDASEDEKSEGEQSEGEQSQDESQAEVVPEPTWLTQFISWAGNYKNGMVAQSKEDATSLKISKVNKPVVAGDIGVFTKAYGNSIKSEGQDYADFYIGVFEYDHSIFSYKMTSMEEPGVGSANTRIPEDGYVLAIYKTYSDKVAAMVEANKKCNADEAPADRVIFFPHGIVVNNGLDATIKKTAAAPTLDGVVSNGEYGNVVWDIQPSNPLANYAQFEDKNYYSTAKVYMTYDAEYVYLAVVVDSPYHICKVTNNGDTGMYQHESIQVNFNYYTNDSEYFAEHWDWGGSAPHDNDASKMNFFRQLGYCCNSETGETYKVQWIGSTFQEGSEAKVVRDNGAQTTTYEVKIPFADSGHSGVPALTGTPGTRFGLSVSINSGNGASFKNVILRDGGGIISINDMTKVPAITLG